MFKKFPVFIVILFENQIQTTSTSPYRTQVQPAASFLVCSLIFIEYKSFYEKRNMFMKKLHRAFNVFSCFQTHEKEVHPDPNSLSHFKAREKKTQKGLNSLSCFKAHEKKTQPGLNSLPYFRAHEKEIHPDPTRSLISRLVKKRPTGPQLALSFQGS